MTVDHAQVPIGAGSHDLEDPRLACLIQSVGPSVRAMTACHKLQVRTIRDFLNRPERDFTDLRNCGKRTYQDLVLRVHQFLANLQGHDAVSSPDQALEQPLSSIVANPRALRAFSWLGISSVQDFLNTPKGRLLSIRGFGERTYWEVSQRIREVTRPQAPASSLLPDTLAELPLDRLQIHTTLIHALRSREITTAGKLIAASIQDLRGDPSIGEDGVTHLRAALNHVIRAGTDQVSQASPAKPGTDFTEFVDDLMAALDAPQRRLFQLRLGLGNPPATLKSAAAQLSISEEEAHILEGNTRLCLRERAPELLARLRDQIEDELQRNGGFTTPDRFLEGTLLHSGLQTHGDGQVPLRLIQVCFAHELFRYGQVITTLNPGDYRRLSRTLRRATAASRLPIAVAHLESLVSRVASPTPTGLMWHILKQRSGLTTSRDPKVGEILNRATTDTADRLARVLTDLDHPASAQEIGKIYRRRHDSATLEALTRHLRRDPRFLEVARDTFSLRNRHLDELSQARAESERVVDLVASRRGQQCVFSIHQQARRPERMTYLVIACLRHDPRVRYLGRGRICTRTDQSALLARIHEAIRTGGRRLEVSRYTDGQAEHKQRVIRRLTRHNRSLVAPAPGYIDALENYPVTADRLQRMWDLTQARLSAGTGQATAQSLLSVINRTGLGGPWLNIHLFTDLLRRHTHFQILANGLVTQPPSACAGSTEHEAREYTREASPGSSTQDPAGSSTVPTSADVRPHELHDQRPDDGRFIDERPCSLA